MDIEKWNPRMLSMRMYVGNSLSKILRCFPQIVETRVIQESSIPTSYLSKGNEISMLKRHPDSSCVY